MERWNRVRLGFARYKISALVATSRVNVRYLTGFSGTSGMAVVTQEDVHLITDGRYSGRAQEEAFPGVQVHIISPGEDLWSVAVDLLPVGVRVGLESWHLSVERWMRIQKVFRKKDLQRVRVGSLLEYVRAHKEPDEIARMKKAQKMIEEVVAELLGELTPGKTLERDLAVELQYRLKKRGADDVSFDPIIASGPESAVPHAQSRPVPIQPNSVLLVDVGAVVEGYCSDMTRTFWVGPERPDPEFKKAYMAVLEAQEIAIQVIRDGVRSRVPDEQARKVLRQAGLESFYTHGLGHGVGLEIHEYPGLSVHNPDNPLLETNMVVTVEPGVYLPGKFGIRIEDMVRVTETGVENLTGFPKELQVL